MAVIKTSKRTVFFILVIFGVLVIVWLLFFVPQFIIAAVYIAFAQQVQFGFPGAASVHALLLYPEKGLLLNPTGAAILKLCTGEQTLSEIVAALVVEFQSDTEKVQTEVLTFIQGLLDRGLIQAEP